MLHVIAKFETVVGKKLTEKSRESHKHVTANPWHQEEEKNDNI